MAKPRVLFLNIGWMTAYKGQTSADKLKGGGQYVKEHASGGEIFNFKPHLGRYYGYARPANDSIALERLGTPEGSEFIDGIMVVWVARSLVVGW